MLRDNRDVIWPRMVARNFGMPRGAGPRRAARHRRRRAAHPARPDRVARAALDPPPDGPIELRVPRIIALRTENVQAAYDDLSARGIEFVSQPAVLEERGHRERVRLPRSRRADRRVHRVRAGPAGQPHRRGPAASVVRPRVTDGACAAELFETSKRWGRWGTDDERGALNLLTPERVAAAAALVRTGEAVSCGRELAGVTVPPTIRRPRCITCSSRGDLRAARGSQASADFVGVSFHGMATSHIDALCHVFVDGQMYNGFPASDVKSIGAPPQLASWRASTASSGAACCSTSRALRGVEWLEPGDAITPDELEAREKAHRRRASTQGDILLVATGRDARRAEHGPWNPIDDRARRPRSRVRPVAARRATSPCSAPTASPTSLPRTRSTGGRCRSTSARSSAWACTCSTTCSSADLAVACAAADALGVPVRRGAAADRRRHRLAGEPGRGPVTRRMR